MVVAWLWPGCVAMRFVGGTWEDEMGKFMGELMVLMVHISLSWGLIAYKVQSFTVMINSFYDTDGETVDTGGEKTTKNRIFFINKNNFRNLCVFVAIIVRWGLSASRLVWLLSNLSNLNKVLKGTIWWDIFLGLLRNYILCCLQPVLSSAIWCEFGQKVSIVQLDLVPLQLINWSICVEWNVNKHLLWFSFLVKFHMLFHIIWGTMIWVVLLGLT